MALEHETKADRKAKYASVKPLLIFSLVLFALIGFAALRSSIATRPDSFTFDEACHIGADVAYVQTGDFRLNPEHSPLIKL